MNQNISNKIQELWALAQCRKLPWQDVYKHLSIYFETMVVMREHESIQELIFLMELSIQYQINRWEQKRRLYIVR